MDADPFQVEPRLRPILIAGPTATGKSEAALRIAESLGGEIVTVDSMQVYRGMDIGTAKPSADERARVPHHLLDVAELNAPFDVATFLSLTGMALAHIQGRGRVPVLCGGTGLYFQALLHGLGSGPKSDSALRTELEQTPLAQLLAELEQHDPQGAAAIDRRNPRRVIRAVEVLRLSGQPILQQRAEWPTSTEDRPALNFFVLSREPEDLRRRIDQRVDAMFARGLVAETTTLLQQGLANNRNAMQALGYRQVIEHLRGERGLPETIQLVKSRTRKYAKRQLTWFKHQMQAEWLSLRPEQDGADAAKTLLERLATPAREG